MTLRQEINQDIIDICDRLLTVLSGYTATNDTAEGRMIFQCRWLKEQAASDALNFPVEDYVHTLRYVYAEELMQHLASSPNAFWNEIGIDIYRLLKLVKGQPLVKPAYYPYVIRCIEALIGVLRTANRQLDRYEQGVIDELLRLKQLLTDGNTPLPLESYFPDYPNLREVYSLTAISIDDLPNGANLCKTVTDSVFEGVRPKSWKNTELADRHTEKF